MDKLWKGRFSKGLAPEADGFNSSLLFDKRLYYQDITGSLAHAGMLAACGIISDSDCAQITEGLLSVLADINDGTLVIDGAEDIHSFVENELTARIGDTGKKLHTARSRNDQVALDLRMYLRDANQNIISLLKGLIKVICALAEKHTLTVMPGYTHLQRAQPISFAQQLMAYACMLLRDISRFEDCNRRMNVSPLGSCALAGTTYPIDRNMTAESLGFDSACINSIDGVSDRDFVCDTVYACSVTMMHLSRFSEELILWSSWEFGFIEADDTYSTGSSIMPQKKNSDIAELVRGKTGRVYGDLTAILTTLKGLPLAYNKDMQEDKECVFDAVDTLTACLTVFAPMLATVTVKEKKMRAAASEGFINATDCADYLAKKGVPFRTAYKITGELVAKCISEGKTLETLTLEEYKAACPEFDGDVYDFVDMDVCMQKRNSLGGTSPEAVEKQIKSVLDAIE